MLSGIARPTRDTAIVVPSGDQMGVVSPSLLSPEMSEMPSGRTLAGVCEHAAIASTNIEYVIFLTHMVPAQPHFLTPSGIGFR